MNFPMDLEVATLVIDWLIGGTVSLVTMVGIAFGWLYKTFSAKSDKAEKQIEDNMEVLRDRLAAIHARIDDRELRYVEEMRSRSKELSDSLDRIV